MDPIVELESGLIRGVVEKHEDGFDYYAFKGIPYAKPPINELRFEDPVPANKWSGVLDCKSYGPIGVQHDTIINCNSYDEDCLNLNVYTRSIDDQNANNSVIVVICSFDLLSGCVNDVYCGPNHLIRKNIVLVSVNFRMGIFGFLDLEDQIASGNQGLKDVVMALQWVQRNIQVFGGDRDNITLQGITAGGAFAHLLALSPLAKGLFHKLIMQGTVMHHPWIVKRNPKSAAMKFCSLLGKNLEDPMEIVKFLKTIDSKKLLETQNIFMKIADFVPFGPGIDSKSLNPFMPIPPCIAADEGVHLPCLVGHTSRPALLLLEDEPREKFYKMANLDSGKILLFGLQDLVDRYNLNIMQVKQLYFKNEAVSESSLETLVKIQSELLYFAGIHQFIKIQMEQSSASTYYYQFNYDSQKSLSKALLKDAPIGTAYMDELPYLFKMGLYAKVGGQDFLKNSRDYKMMEQMTEMWANFAKYGRPTVATSELLPVHWLPVDDGMYLRHLSIDENLTMQSTINIEQKLLSAKSIIV